MNLFLQVDAGGRLPALVVRIASIMLWSEQETFWPENTGRFSRDARGKQSRALGGGLEDASLDLELASLDVSLEIILHLCQALHRDGNPILGSLDLGLRLLGDILTRVTLGLHLLEVTEVGRDAGTLVLPGADLVSGGPT